MWIVSVLAIGVVAGCGGSSGDEEPPPRDEPAPPARESGSIVVPEIDRTPPRAIVRVSHDPLVVTVVGRDSDGGMGRARVSIRAQLLCRVPDGDVSTQGFVRYVPPPQIERIRIAPGTRTRTELRRTVTQRFDSSDCRRGSLEGFRGEAWADVTNASGLDATSKHIRFVSGDS